MLLDMSPNIRRFVTIAVLIGMFLAVVVSAFLGS